MPRTNRPSVLQGLPGCRRLGREEEQERLQRVEVAPRVEGCCEDAAVEGARTSRDAGGGREL